MKILNLSLDDKILDPLSGVTRRIYEYGQMCEKYTVIVPADRDYRNEISAKTEILSVSGWKPVQLAKIYFLARYYIKKHHYDVISVQDAYYLAWLGYLLASKFRIGLELQIHGFERYSGLRKLVARLVIPRANSVRTVSRRFKRILTERFRLDPEKVTVVPIYTDIAIRRAGARAPGKRTVFLTVSRLVKIKNIELQIEAVKRLLGKGKDIELKIVGAGPEEKNLRRQSRGFEDRIKFSGWVSELDEIYSDADIFLLSSDREGWGLVVIEAASHGLPVIMTDVGCAGEIVANNENGLVVPVGNAEALTAAMEKYIDNYALRESHIKALQEKIKALPDKKETLKLYKKSWEKALPD